MHPGSDAACWRTTTMLVSETSPPDRTAVLPELKSGRHGLRPSLRATRALHRTARSPRQASSRNVGMFAAEQTDASRPASVCACRERSHQIAHLAIAFCRCMNIPARYCTGYLGDYGTEPPYGSMDFAGWFEAFLGDRWYIHLRRAQQYPASRSRADCSRPRCLRCRHWPAPSTRTRWRVSESGPT